MICRIEVEGRNFPVDLHLFIMKDFDIILGMDWLANHHASINYRNKKDVLSYTKEGEVLF
jgi:hypothetical protein